MTHDLRKPSVGPPLHHIYATGLAALLSSLLLREHLLFPVRLEVLWPFCQDSNAQRSPIGAQPFSVFSINGHHISWENPWFLVKMFHIFPIDPRRVVQRLGAQDRRKLPMSLHRREGLQHVGRRRRSFVLWISSLLIETI